MNYRKTSIIILTYNNLMYTKKCITSVRKHTAKGEYEIIVVDNNSADGTVEYLKKQSDLKLVLNKENLGFPKGCNQGIKQAEPENDILLLNNDVIVTSNWLLNLKIALYSNEKIGAVGPVSNSCAYYQSIPVDYKNEDEMLKFAMKFNISDKNKWEFRLKLIGFCMLIKREIVNQIGYLDDMFTPGNYEDDDYSMRILEAGYELVLCRDTFIHHYGGMSFNKNDKFSKLLQVNEKKFEDKWMFSPRYELDLVPCIDQLIEYRANANVLEINCGCGADLLKVKYVLKDSNLFGIDKNKYALSICKNFATTESVDFADFDIKFKGKIDYVLFKNYKKEYIGYLEKINLNKNAKILIIIHNKMYINNQVQSKNYDDINSILFSLKRNNYKIEDGLKYTVVNNSLDEDAAKSKYGEDCFVKYFIFSVCRAENDTIENILVEIDNNINVEDNFNKLLYKFKNGENILNEFFKIVDNILKNKVDILNTLGALCYTNGIFGSVIPILNKALEYDNTNYAVLMNLSEVSFDIGEYETALKYLDNIKEISEEKNSLLKKVKKEYDFQRSIKFALREIENSVCEDEGANYILDKLSNNKIDDKYLINIIDKDIIKKVYVLNYTAIKCFESKLYDYVIPLLNRAIELQPADTDSIYNMGYILYTFGEKELALNYLRRMEGTNSEIDKLILSIERANMK